MMEFTQSQITLLSMLSDGACHSGSTLGQALGVTRSAIWKQINQLVELGVPIKSVPQRGYQLPHPLIMLDKHKLKKKLEESSTSFNLHLFTSIDSTNRFLKELPTSQQIEVCCAEVQTHGRGRFGRQWHSPFGANIYCSSRWNLNYDIAKLSGLSLITSLAILNSLNELNLGSEIKIKWPNDLYWNDKKLCGSLIEILAESNSNAQIIIGIGLNVNSDTENNPLSDKPWCSLYAMTHRYFDRNLVTASLITNLQRYLVKFINNDLNAFMEEWNKADYLQGKQIDIVQATGTLSGKACGINSMGLLIVEDETGKKHLLSSGDTSLHKHNN